MAFLAWLGGLLGSLLKVFVQTPPPVAVEDKKLGEVTQELVDVEATDAATAKGDAAAAAVSTAPGGVYAPDPFERPAGE